MSALALAAPAPSDGYAARLAELIDVDELTARGWNAPRQRFVPLPSDPLFGYQRCPVRGCQNVTVHTPTTLCSRCQHRYGRFVRAHDDASLEAFLVAVTQTRSEDLERLCLVCRTPGHERPVAAHELCYSCLRQATKRGQSSTAYLSLIHISEPTRPY